MSTPSVAQYVGVTLVSRAQRHRVILEQQALQYPDLVQQAEACLLLARRRLPRTWTLVYRDDEDDLVTVSNATEFAEAKRVFCQVLAPQQGLDILPEMEFFIVPKSSLKDQLAPMLDKAEQLGGQVARLAVHTTENLRKSQVIGKGRESLVASRRVLATAGRGVSQRLRRVSSAVEGVVERRRSRSRGASATEEENVPLVGEDGNTPDAVSIAVAPDAGDEGSDETEMPALIPAVMPMQQQQRSGSDTETESSESEDTSREWDVVASPLRLGMIDYESEDDLEAAFREHAAELTAIREILPDIDVDVCLETLYEHDFQLEPTLLALME